jgi:hypothetical protein
LRGLTARAACLAACLASHACVSNVSLEGAKCPCADGFKCCVDVCVPVDEACPVGRECLRPPVTEPVLEIGEGSGTDTVFEPLSPEGRLVLHSGLQGGYHIYVQLRALGIEPDMITLTRTLRDPESGDLLRLQSEILSMVCPVDETGWILSQGQLLFVCPSLVSGQQMNDRDLRLDVEAVDADGNRLEASAIVHPVCPAGDLVCPEEAPGCAAAP